MFLAQSIVGRNVYALGGNPVVARFSGINVNRYRVGIYIMSGVAAGLAGILLAARTGSGQPISGSQGLELEAITAAVLGGCALQGGKGTIVGALLGVAIIGMLNNGMILTVGADLLSVACQGLPADPCGGDCRISLEQDVTMALQSLARAPAAGSTATGDVAASSLKDRIARDLGQRILSGELRAAVAAADRGGALRASTVPAAPRCATPC